MSPLRVALLGTPRVEHAGQQVGFDTRKATALLAYLAVTGNRHSRDTLGALLWPEQTATQARGALRRTMSVLNAATGGQALDADRSSVAVPAQTPPWLDVEEFTRLAACRTHGHDAAASCDRCVTDLTAAAALYRGDFLAGFAVRDCPDFDDWQSFQAQGLRQQLGRVLERLAAALVAAGAADAAVGPARRWLALDPLHEPAHALLMTLYAQTGRRSLAMQQYRECVGVLHRELGVSPLSSTVDLDALVRSGRLHQVPAGPASPREIPVTAGDVAPVVPMVGRVHELAVLTEAARSAAPHGRLVVLAGEAGVGKTRLLTELGSVLGGRVVGARCHEGEEGVAFGVMTDLLHAVLAREPTAFGSLPVPWQAEVGRLVPEALGSAVPEPPTLDSPGAQGRFCAALVAAVAAGAAGAAAERSVVTVEDLQWCDASSLGVLAYLVRRLRDVPVVVVLTWRPGAAGPAQHLATAVAAAAREGLARTVELPRLDRAAVAELAEAVLPQAPSPQVVSRLWQETGGLPLLVSEYLAAFSADGTGLGQDQWQLPGGVRELLAGRLGRLSEMTRQVLAAAAVLDPDVRPRLLRATSGRGEEEVVAALEEAAAAGILVEGRPGATYEFAQDAMRRVVDDGTSLARRRLLHSRAADALAGERSPHDPTAAVAAHLRLAGRDTESAEWSWRAAQRAIRLYAHAEALEHLAAAAALGHPGGSVQRATGDVLTVLGHYREALLAYDRGVAACAPGDEVTSAALEHRLAEVHHRMGAWDLADSHLSTALELLTTVDEPSLRARVLADTALVAYRRGAATAAAGAAGEALSAATAARDDAALAQVHDVLGVLAADRADLVEAEEHLRQSLRHAERLPDLGARVAALNNLSLLHAAAGQPDEALARARQALELGLAHGDRHRAAALHTNLADVLHAAGEQTEAQQHLTAAARLFAEVDDEQLRRPEIWKLTRW